MVITDRFVYIHPHKTGGTFVENVLKSLPQGPAGKYNLTIHRVLRQHQTVREIPKAHRHKPVLVTVRNPYDFYVSLYEFGRWKWRSNRFFHEHTLRLRYPHYPHLAFSEFMEVLNNWSLGLLRPRPGRPWNRLVFEKARIGFFSFFFLQFVSEQPLKIIERIDYYAQEERYRNFIPDVHFIDMANLNRELYDFLLKMGYDAEKLEFVLAMEKILPPNSPRDGSSHWSGYYSPTMFAQVRYLDRAMFEIFPQFQKDYTGQVHPSTARLSEAIAAR